MADTQPQQPSAQSQVNDALKASVANEDKPLDLNQLVFKTMPKGYAVPKNYIAPQPTVAPTSVAPASSMAAITGTPATAPLNGAPVTPVTPPPVISPEPQHSRSRLWIWIGVVIVVLAAAAAGYFYFVHTSPSTAPASFTQPTQSATTPPVTTPTDTSTPVTTTPTTTTPPVTTDTTPTPPTSAIPAAWLSQYFPTTMVSGVCPAANQGICGDTADPDSDGLTNLQEYNAKTDPSLADTDSDGIADGDEVNVFLTDPLSAHTSGVAKYTDSGDISNKYNSVAKAPFTTTDLTRIASAIKQYGLHQPTTKTLTQDSIEFYTNYQMAS